MFANVMLVRIDLLRLLRLVNFMSLPYHISMANLGRICKIKQKEVDFLGIGSPVGMS